METPFDGRDVHVLGFQTLTGCTREAGRGSLGENERRTQASPPTPCGTYRQWREELFRWERCLSTGPQSWSESAFCISTAGPGK
jgi:hypothetical protein